MKRDYILFHGKDAAFVELLPQITDGRHGAVGAYGRQHPDEYLGRSCGTLRSVFYPMQAFSKQREVDFREVPFSLLKQKRPEDTELLKAVAGTLSDKVYEADSSNAGVFIWQLSLPVTLPTICSSCRRVLEKYHLPFDVMLPPD